MEVAAMTASERESIAIVLAHFGLPFKHASIDCRRGELYRKAERSYSAIYRSMTMDEKVAAMRRDKSCMD
jgi:hypothetical protein